MPDLNCQNGSLLSPICGLHMAYPRNIFNEKKKIIKKKKPPSKTKQAQNKPQNGYTPLLRTKNI